MSPDQHGGRDGDGNGRRPVRIAFSVQPQHAGYADIRRAVVAAEELGADVVTVWDHFFPLFGDPAGKHFEAWMLLAGLAEVTSRVELSPLVSPVGYRNPDLLADMARTVDHVSGGRVILGLGAGWSERDYEGYGYGPLPSPAERLDALEAALPRIRRRLDRLNPPPVRRIPLLVGGSGPRRTLRLVARHADLWHGIGTPEELRARMTVLDEWCAAEGRDPAAVERSTVAGAPTSTTTPSVAVSPEVLGPQLVETGFTLLNVRSSGPALDLGSLREWLAFRDSVNRAR
jgi:probable F420-dependent oxidoreductase